MKVARLSGIVPHIQSSTSSKSGQHAAIASVSEGQTSVDPSWAEVPPDSTSQPHLSANVGNAFGPFAMGAGALARSAAGRQ